MSHEYDDGTLAGERALATARGEDPRVIKYREAIAACHLAATVLSGHDIEGLLRDIERADALGPVVNPSLWMAKGKAMREDREVLRTALPLAQLGRKLQGMTTDDEELADPPR